jgi:hypothetical protein
MSGCRCSGAFEFVESFHLYFELAGPFFNPHQGFPGCCLPVDANGKLSKDVSQLDLYTFNLYIRMYTYIQQSNVQPGTAAPAIVALAQDLSPVAPSAGSSSQSPMAASDTVWDRHPELWAHALRVYHEVKPRVVVPAEARRVQWTIVPLESGSLLVRDARIPYRTLRNRSEQSPFLYAYCTMSKIKAESRYYNSDDWKTLGKCNRKIQGTASHDHEDLI